MKIAPDTIECESPSFNSQRLTESFEAVSEIFDLHQQDINSVSNDIRNLELYLKSRNVAVAHSETYTPRKRGNDIRLSWDKGPGESSGFRIMCGVAEFIPEAAGFGIVEERPLIECPLATRMAAYPFLPNFMTSLATAIQVYSRPPKTAAVTDDHASSFNEDSIPF